MEKVIEISRYKFWFYLCFYIEIYGYGLMYKEWDRMLDIKLWILVVLGRRSGGGCVIRRWKSKVDVYVLF